jgi:hypothetical protein
VTLLSASMPPGGTTGCARGPGSGERPDSEHWVESLIPFFSAGRLDAVQRALDDTATPGDLVGDVMRADVRNRRMTVTVAELVTLQERIESHHPAEGALAAWVAAIIAERLVLDGDPAAYAVVLTALHQFQDPEPSSRLDAYARARLLRLGSLASLLLPTSQASAQHAAMHDEAVALLVRHGLLTEAKATEGAAAGARIMTHVDRPDDVDRLRDARAAVPDAPPTPWSVLLDMVLGCVALVHRDATMGAAAYERIDAMALLHPRMSYITTYGRAAFRLLADGPSPGALETLRGALDHCRADPRFRYDAMSHAATILLDQRSPHGPSFAAQALDSPTIGPIDMVERELLNQRVQASLGACPSGEHALALVHRLDGWGRRRLAGRHALRLARDLSESQPEVAHLLYRWGIERLPPAPGCTAEELVLRCPPSSRPGPASGSLRSPGPSVITVAGDGRAPSGPSDPLSVPPDAPCPALLEVRVLGPDLDVRVAGESRPLARRESLLVLHLALSHPHGVTVPSLLEALWPDRPVTRRRLNTLVHRLRTALGPAAEAVRRSRDRVWLDDESCHTDLCAYRAALAASEAERVQAVVSVTGNLCAASHPFGGPLADTRERFAREWLVHARSLVRSGSVTLHQLHRARAALGLLDDPLDGE